MKKTEGVREFYIDVIDWDDLDTSYVWQNPPDDMEDVIPVIEKSAFTELLELAEEMADAGRMGHLTHYCEEGLGISPNCDLCNALEKYEQFKKHRRIE